MEFALVLRWLLPVAALWTLALPLAAALFPRFPDRGASVALPVALVALFVPVYWIGRLHLGAGIVAGAGLLVAGAVVLVRRGVTLPGREALPAVVVFAVAFGVALFLKGAYPWIVPAGGEKFLDFGLVNAVLRSGVPPEDPWFAGRRVRYYYGGHLLVAVLTRLSGVAPRYAFVLAHPTVYAALATGAYGLGGAVAARRGRSPRPAGAASVVLVCAAGTLATPVRMAFGLLPGDLRREYGRAVVAGVRGQYADVLAGATDPAAWGAWYGRYVIPDVPTAFPMWTFANGDLRPHMLSAPLLVLAAALGAAYCWTPADRRRRRLALLGGAFPAVAGALAVVNTWELPVAAGLAGLAAALADASPASLLPAAWRPQVDPGSALARAGGVEAGRVLAGGVTAVAVALAGAASVAPYLLHGTAPTRGVGLFPPRSPLVPFVLAYGLFLVPFWLSLGRATLAALPRRFRPALLGAGACGAAACALFVVGDAAAVAVVGPPLVVAWALRRTGRIGYGGVLVVAGAGVLLVVEFAYAVVWPFDPAAPRWNTVYKASHAAWLLWGVAGGVAAAGVFGRGWRALAGVLGAVARPRAGHGAERDRTTDDPTTARRTDGGSGGRWRAAGAVLAAGLVVAVLAGGAVFPALATSDRADLYRDPLVEKVSERSLDGLAHVDGTYPDDAAAIAWLDRREDVTLVSAPGADRPTPTYTWVNAPSSLTGHATLAGWAHERGYRGDAAYERRLTAVETVYEGSPAAARRVLDRYGVTHVYLGPNERARYAVRDPGRVPGVEPAFRHGNVTVYAVGAADDTAANASVGTPVGDRLRGKRPGDEHPNAPARSITPPGP